MAHVIFCAMTKKPWTDPYPGLPRKNLFGPVVKEGQSRPQPVERIQRPTLNLKDVPGVTIASELPCPAPTQPLASSEKPTLATRSRKMAGSERGKSERGSSVPIAGKDSVIEDGAPPASSPKKITPKQSPKATGRGRPKIEEPRPWEAEGISRRTWYRRHGK